MCEFYCCAELPQISIRAAIRQKKPFQLQFPRITFNSHVSATEEDDTPSYDSSNGGYEQPAQAGYGQSNGNAGYGQSNGNAGGYGQSNGNSNYGGNDGEYQSRPY